MAVLPLDAYGFRAQLAPALLVLLPVIVGLLVWLPSFAGTAEAVLGAVIAAAGSVFLAQVGRDAGKRQEPALFQIWGGKPTTKLLRHADATIEPGTKRRYHSFLARAVPGIRMPSREEEAENPGLADEVYDSAVQWLLARTRDLDEHRLVFAENVNYGFRRNLWGLRPVGLAVSAICSALSVVTVVGFLVAGHSVPTGAYAGTLLIVAVVLVWALVVRSEWVAVPAFAFARAVLHTCDLLAGDDGGS